MERNQKARSFVFIMIVIAVFAFCLRIGIEQIIKINIVQNESNAQTALKLISVALENYSKDNHGIFPSSLLVLTKTQPVYLDQDYVVHSPIKGYLFSCLSLEPTGYRCSAVPLKCRLTGKNSFTVTTGGLLFSEGCSRIEGE